MFTGLKLTVVNKVIAKYNQLKVSCYTFALRIKISLLTLCFVEVTLKIS